MKAWLAVVLTTTACGGTFIAALQDASFDDAAAVPDSSGDSTAVNDVQVDYASWFAQFDAGTYDGRDPPLPGEYPMVDGGGPCNVLGQCLPFANCDDSTGWCCSGEGKTLSSGVAGCECGNTLGCLPPQVCCYFPDVFVPSCAASLDACPGGHTPWK